MCTAWTVLPSSFLRALFGAAVAAVDENSAMTLCVTCATCDTVQNLLHKKKNSGLNRLFCMANLCRGFVDSATEGQHDTRALDARKNKSYSAPREKNVTIMY